MALCTGTYSVMSPQEGRAPSQGVAAEASSSATEVRLGVGRWEFLGSLFGLEDVLSQCLGEH